MAAWPKPAPHYPLHYRRRLYLPLYSVYISSVQFHPVLFLPFPSHLSTVPPAHRDLVYSHEGAGEEKGGSKGGAVGRTSNPSLHLNESRQRAEEGRNWPWSEEGTYQFRCFRTTWSFHYHWSCANGRGPLQHRVLVRVPPCSTFLRRPFPGRALFRSLFRSAQRERECHVRPQSAGHRRGAEVAHLRLHPLPPQHSWGGSNPRPLSTIASASLPLSPLGSVSRRHPSLAELLLKIRHVCSPPRCRCGPSWLKSPRMVVWTWSRHTFSGICTNQFRARSVSAPLNLPDHRVFILSLIVSTRTLWRFPSSPVRLWRKEGFGEVCEDGRRGWPFCSSPHRAICLRGMELWVGENNFLCSFFAFPWSRPTSRFPFWPPSLPHSVVHVRGFPLWLHFIPGIKFRTDSEPFKVCSTCSRAFSPGSLRSRASQKMISLVSLFFSCLVPGGDAEVHGKNCRHDEARDALRVSGGPHHLSAGWFPAIWAGQEKTTAYCFCVSWKSSHFGLMFLRRPALDQAPPWPLTVVYRTDRKWVRKRSIALWPTSKIVRQLGRVDGHLSGHGGPMGDVPTIRRSGPYRELKLCCFTSAAHRCE